MNQIVEGQTLLFTGQDSQKFPKNLSENPDKIIKDTLKT